MSEMVRRGAQELYEREPFSSTVLGGELSWCRANELAPQHPQLQQYIWRCENNARAALLAALDPEDDALRRAIMGAPFHKPDTVDVTAIINAIRNLITQGEKTP